MYEISSFEGGSRTFEPSVATSTEALGVTQTLVGLKQVEGAEVVRLQAVLRMLDGSIIVIEAEEA